MATMGGPRSGSRRRLFGLGSALAATLALSLAACSATSPIQPDATAGSGASSTPADAGYAAAASSVASSVVGVEIQGIDVPGHPEVDVGGGSGIIISSDGHILTNDHVVEGATSLTVDVGPVSYPAKVVGRDGSTDVAVLKIPANGLATARFGDPNALRPGDRVLTVGNPYGMEHSIGHGIVSAINRASTDPSGLGASIYTNLIQTDAPINPGNSGGALATADGRIVGITSLGIGPTGGSTGVGFAIPIDAAMNIAAQLIKRGHAKHPTLGLDVATLEDHDASALGLPLLLHGALVRGNSPTSTGAAAGIRKNDVIVSVGGIPTPSAGHYYGAMRKQRIGATVPLVLRRKDGTTTVKAKVGSSR